jgi:hypothetical protein
VKLIDETLACSSSFNSTAEYFIVSLSGGEYYLVLLYNKKKEEYGIDGANTVK